MTKIYKNNDIKYEATIYLDGVQIDPLDLVQVVYEVYDSKDVLIQTFSEPVGGNSPLTISNNVVEFKVFSSNLTNKSEGQMYAVRRIKVDDSDYPDTTYDDNQKINIGYLQDAI